MNAKETFQIIGVSGEVPTGSGVEALDESGFAVVHYAAANGDGRVLEALVEAGANLDLLSGDCETAFDIAVFEGHFEWAEQVLDGRPIQEPRPNGYNALDLVAMHGKIEAAIFLISMGARVDGSAGLRPPIVWAVQEDRGEMVQLLLSYGASALANGDPTFDSQSAVELAAADGNLPILRQILEHVACGAESSAKMRKSLELAQAYGHAECERLLMDALTAG